MWHTIESNISAHLQRSFKIKAKREITTSDLNQCYWISDEHQHFFVKLNDKNHLAHFELQAFDLNKLTQTNQITCPKVIDYGVTLDKSYLLLDYIPFEQPNAKNWYQLGAQLAQLHKGHSHGQFGWQFDNYLGDTLQPNRWSSNWKTFFAEQRIGWQLQLLSEKSIHLGDIDHIVTHCHDVLLGHSVTPCLLHGDLWQGNIGFSENQCVIFDPACYYGDREVDLAMTELYGYLPEQFYAGYQHVFPVDAHYHQRKHLYNLYHILNHANTFGGHYLIQAKAALSKVMAIKNSKGVNK